MRRDHTAFLSQIGCRFFALGPFLPEDGVEIALPIKPRNLPVGTIRIKVLNAKGKYLGGWNIDLLQHDLDSELELPLLDLSKYQGIAQ